MKSGLVVLIASLGVVAAVATAGVLINRRSNGPEFTADAKIASRPQYTYVNLAGGTSAGVRLLTALSSETSQIGDPVAAVLISSWSADGRTALPAGTRVEGQVTNAESTGRLKHNAKLAFRFDQVRLPNGERVGIVSRPFSLAAGGETKRDLITVGAGTVAGGVIGAITGNTKRGVVIGAAAGTGAALAHKGDAVTLRAGSTLRLSLSEGLRVAVKKSRV